AASERCHEVVCIYTGATVACQIEGGQLDTLSPPSSFPYYPVVIISFLFDAPRSHPCKCSPFMGRIGVLACTLFMIVYLWACRASFAAKICHCMFTLRGDTKHSF
ncbi:unnamed protein product, partial [Ixodes persulcatus]